MAKLFEEGVVKYEGAGAPVATAPTQDVILSEEVEIEVLTVTSDDSTNAVPRMFQLAIQEHKTSWWKSEAQKQLENFSKANHHLNC